MVDWGDLFQKGLKFAGEKGLEYLKNKASEGSSQRQGYDPSKSWAGGSGTVRKRTFYPGNSYAKYKQKTSTHMAMNPKSAPVMSRDIPYGKRILSRPVKEKSRLKKPLKSNLSLKNYKRNRPIVA